MSLKSIVKLSLAAVATLAVFSVYADAVPAGTDDEIRARLAPSGSVCRTGEDCGATTAAVAGGVKSGEDVYNQFCFACHATGASDAPLFADAESWAPRLEKGAEAMFSSTLNGLGMMPPKGTCMDCSDEELQAAIDHMLDEVR